jgi:hypothetical protein
LSSPQPSPQSVSSLPTPLSPPSLLPPPLPKSLSSDGICGECFIGEIEGSLVHCGECPRSYHVPRKFNSGNRNTRSRSNACSVSYVKEVEVDTVFTCEIMSLHLRAPSPFI